MFESYGTVFWPEISICISFRVSFDFEFTIYIRKEMNYIRAVEFFVPFCVGHIFINAPENFCYFVKIGGQESEPGQKCDIPITCNQIGTLSEAYGNTLNKSQKVEKMRPCLNTDQIHC